MRLTVEQRSAIHEEVVRVFGSTACVRVFRSRIDDAARGGDIDIHVQSAGTPAQLLACELKLRARLARRLGDRRLDVIVQGGDGPPREIDCVALDTGIRL